jgi:hypothetical protein
VLSGSDVGSTIVAKATYTDGHGTAEAVASAATAAVANVNYSPTGSVTISGTATQNQTLTASNTIADIDGLGAITYHWYRAGVDTGATGSTYVLSESDVGSIIVAKATYTDGHGTAETVASAATAAVTNVNDNPTGSVTISGTATQNQTLTASNTIADIDGLGTITYHWLRDGLDTGATGNTYVLAEADVGAAISTRATYTDAHGAAESVTSSATPTITNFNDSPTGSVTITGTAEQNQTLTASNTLADLDGLGPITYHWLRDGIDTGRTGGTYILTQSDVGSSMSVQATYTDGHGATEMVTSTATAATANVNDAPTLPGGNMSASANPDTTFTSSALLSASSDLDGDPLSVQVLSSVSHGQLTVLGDGSLRYEAAAGFSGTDQFTYVAFDGQLQSGSRTVVITVIGVPGPTPDIDEPVIGGGSTAPTPSTGSTAPSGEASAPATKPDTPPTNDDSTPTKPTQAPAKSNSQDESASKLPTVSASNSHAATNSQGLSGARTTGTYAVSPNRANGFAFSLELGKVDFGLVAGNPVLAQISSMKPLVDGGSSQTLHLSLSTATTHGDTHAARLVFSETPDDRLVHVQKVAVQTSGAVVSVGAVWWAARVSGLLASLMISTPAWRSIDPLPVMGLAGGGPDDEDAEDEDAAVPEGQARMDEKAAGLFGANPEVMSRELERIG